MDITALYIHLCTLLVTLLILLYETTACRIYKFLIILSYLEQRDVLFKQQCLVPAAFITQAVSCQHHSYLVFHTPFICLGYVQTIKSVFSHTSLTFRHLSCQQDITSFITGYASNLFTLSLSAITVYKYQLHVPSHYHNC